MNTVQAIIEIVTHTATRTFSEPLEIRFPRDEWTTIWVEQMIHEAQDRRVRLRTPEITDMIVAHTTFGEVHLRMEDECQPTSTQPS